MLRLEYAALYAGLNLLILLALAMLVALGRRRHKIVLGDGENPRFVRAVRAHANAAEYIPAGIAGLALLALFEQSPIWLLHASALSLTAGRILHAAGLHAGALNLGRVLGITLTWVSFAMIAGGLIHAGLAQVL